MKSSKKLAAQHKLFAAEYVGNGFNATKACAAAGYAEKSAYSAGPRLLGHPRVQAEIARLVGPRMEALGLKGERVLLELMRIAYADLGQAYGPDGQLLPFAEMPEEIRRVIAGSKVFEEFEGQGSERVKVGEVREIKLADKIKALELLGKHLRLFTELVETKDTTPKDTTPPLTNDERRALLKKQIADEAKIESLQTAPPVK